MSKYSEQSSNTQGTKGADIVLACTFCNAINIVKLPDNSITTWICHSCMKEFTLDTRDKK